MKSEGVYYNTHKIIRHFLFCVGFSFLHLRGVCDEMRWRRGEGGDHQPMLDSHRTLFCFFMYGIADALIRVMAHGYRVRLGSN
ncbi:hypothetical protein V8C26DRAFT_67231 [Trichoderma gracile]